MAQTTADDGVAVNFEEIDKASPAGEELTRTERFFTVGREPENDLPDRTVVGVDD